MTNNPFSVFETEIATFKAQFTGNDGDWKLLCDYLLMPILDVESINDMQITDKQRHRLYYLLKKNAASLRDLLRRSGGADFINHSFSLGNPCHIT